MATSLNSGFKVPIAYFLISKNLSSSERANLVIKAMDHVNDTKCVITNIACDNPKTNLSMLKL